MAASKGMGCPKIYGGVQKYKGVSKHTAGIQTHRGHPNIWAVSKHMGAYEHRVAYGHPLSLTTPHDCPHLQQTRNSSTSQRQKHSQTITYGSQGQGPQTSHECNHL